MRRAARRLEQHREADRRWARSLLGLEDLLAYQCQVDREGADLQNLHQRLGVSHGVEAARDFGPGLPVDPVRVLGKVDDRPGLDFVV